MRYKHDANIEPDEIKMSIPKISKHELAVMASTFLMVAAAVVINPRAHSASATPEFGDLMRIKVPSGLSMNGKQYRCAVVSMRDNAPANAVFSAYADTVTAGVPMQGSDAGIIEKGIIFQAGKDGDVFTAVDNRAPAPNRVDYSLRTHTANVSWNAPKDNQLGVTNFNVAKKDALGKQATRAARKYDRCLQAVARSYYYSIYPN